jgi:hypothetical protein
MQLTFSPTQLVELTKDTLGYYRNEVKKHEAVYQQELDNILKNERRYYGLFWSKSRPYTPAEALAILRSREWTDTKLEENWICWESAISKVQRLEGYLSAFETQTTLVKLSYKDWKFITTGSWSVLDS